jgi:glycosyltransferase involved in cell wall biosynthesis
MAIQSMDAIPSKKRLVILTFADYYLPGYRAGGPIRTLANMVARLSDRYRFLLVARDRDFGDEYGYPGIVSDRWTDQGTARVLYCSPDGLQPVRLARLLRHVNFDVLYLNSVFSPRFTILPLLLMRCGILPPKPVVLAPRGEFSPSALRLKAWKKRPYMAAARVVRLYDRILWHASTEDEVEVIRRHAPVDEAMGRILIAPNLSAEPAVSLRTASPTKRVGHADLVFLSRVCRMKNLDGVLRILKGVRGSVTFHIYGPLEDARYWAECEKAIAELPPRVQVHYHGPVPPSKVCTVLAGHQFFFLPTWGENFGHVILEALSAGLPLILSDQTPWQNLQAQGIGWDLPVASQDAFRAVIECCVAMDDHEYRSLSRAARRYAEDYLADPRGLDANRRLFWEALAMTEMTNDH